MPLTQMQMRPRVQHSQYSPTGGIQTIKEEGGAQGTAEEKEQLDRLSPRLLSPGNGLAAPPGRNRTNIEQHPRMYQTTQIDRADARGDRLR